MLVLTRREQILAATQLASSGQSTVPSYDTVPERLWLAEDDFESPQKSMNFPLASLGKVPSRKDSVNHLRISTCSKPDLHERYMSSEEEPSPSPDSETECSYGEDEVEDEVKHKSNKSAEKEENDLAKVYVEEYKAEIAVAVPIRVMGRPKLVDITNLAPTHKRKRNNAETPVLSRTAAKNATARMSGITNENNPFVSLDSTNSATAEEHLPKRKESLTVLAPESWLPEDNSTAAEEDDHFLPELEPRRPLTRIGYNPYSLHPPKPSPRDSYSNAAKKSGSVARARKCTNASSPMNSKAGSRGLAPPLNLAKRQELYHPIKQIAKKPKMLARGATERTAAPVIPPFPFEDEKAAA
ncbi:MAG: hypothetical protein Q9217_005616 [Psora testacea]